MQLAFGDCSTKRRDRGLEPRFRQRDHVHVAFGHDQPLPFARGLAGRSVVVKVAPFIEQLGFGGVQVFGVIIVDPWRARQRRRSARAPSRIGYMIRLRKVS